MEEAIAELRRQLEEQKTLREAAERREEEQRQAREQEKKAREEAERREEEQRQAREQEKKAREEEEKAREEAERRVQPNTLFSLLDRCHNSLSLAIQVETDATLLTQGYATDPVNRLYPKQVIPWPDFPQLQEQVWQKFERTANFTSRPLFPSNTQIDYVLTNIQNKRIYSEASLRNFERDTVDNFVEQVIDALREDETLRREFGIQGRVSFYDHATPEEASLENSLEQMNIQKARAPQRLAVTRRGKGRGRGGGTAQRETRAGTARRRNRRADQFCVHVMANERQKPVFAVEFKAPHKVTIPELVAGLHPMNLARDVIDQEGDTFEFYATHLIAAVVTQIFSYMIDSGVQYGYICTGEAFVFLHIPKNDPTVVQYYLCIPNQDVQADNEWHLHRTAIGQVLAFALQALAVEAPSQEWYDTANEKLSTWEVEYLDILRLIPETIRKDPPASNYRPSHWKQEPKAHHTRSRARCQPGISTPQHSSTEGSDNNEESHSPSTEAAARSRSSRSQGNNRQSTKGKERTRAGQDKKQTSQKDRQSTRPYCSIACIHGMVNRDTLDKECPNWRHHGGQRHSMGPREFTRQLHLQLVRDRTRGFEPLHIRGRTGYLIKATLLSHGYTVIIKATTAQKQHLLQGEVDNYRRLRSLQGQQIPVCLGTFTPRITYWYHGELMVQMMILSWSGTRLQHVINKENSALFHRERQKALAVLRSHGVIHGDSEWRNMLWDELGGRLMVIDLEDVRWLKGPRALESLSPNTWNGRRTSGGEQATALDQQTRKNSVYA
ncbi:hypothetical protein ARAM_001828 [Aspergillus rambellii]|uniref:Aminoglycoside phosphotransferase domain-containing protein n=1 Tax=Aspergillus rambellii TaxID=308745 RepID=A0A0F8V2M9_9EURO|nr:hypothetical protein ARAM_001828 [Aspergillus rambellii]